MILTVEKITIEDNVAQTGTALLNVVSPATYVS